MLLALTVALHAGAPRSCALQPYTVTCSCAPADGPKLPLNEAASKLIDEMSASSGASGAVKN